MTAAVRTLRMSSSSFEMESNKNEHHCGNNQASTVERADIPDILNPGPHDVLLGRGGGTNNHIGNKNFRDLVSRHKMKYLACSKVDKPKVAREVVSIWRRLDPPGRFLQRKDETKKGPGSIRDDDVVWTEVDDQEARKKASQCLRERTPDIQPYIAHLRKQDDQLSDGQISTVTVQPENNSGGANNNQGLTGTIASVSKANEGSAAGTAFLFGMPDRAINSNINSVLRRGSMPATVHSAGVAFVPGIPHARGTMRTQDRRVSLPPANQLQEHQARGIGTDVLARQEHNSNDSYTAIEQMSDLVPLRVQMQQPFFSNRQSNMQTQFMDMRSILMQKNNDQTMLNVNGAVMGVNMSPQQHNLGVAFAHSINEQTQMLIQQQQYLVRQKQRLLEEQERLVRQEHMIARREAAMAQQEQLVNQMQIHQVKSSTVGSEQNMASMSFAQEPFLLDGSNDLEPVPISEEVYNIPLSGDPDSQLSSNTVQVQGNIPTDLNTMFQDQPENKATKGQDPSTGGGEPSELTLEPGNGSVNEVTDPNALLSEYRKALESYISNNQNSNPSLDVSGDLAEEEGQTVDGVATSDWIEQQLMNDSGDLSMSTKERPKPPRRSSSKKSLMSLAGSADQMSIAFSEMDHFEELSKSEAKRHATRSMSILSTNTNMSELTDFDDLDCL